MTGFRKVAVNAVLWGAVAGSLLGTSSSVAIGIDEPAGDDRCAVFWQAVAFDRTDGYLSEREAVPYLAVLRAGDQQSAPDRAISRAEFIAACRSKAIAFAIPIRVSPPALPASPTRRVICEMPDD